MMLWSRFAIIVSSFALAGAAIAAEPNSPQKAFETIKTAFENKNGKAFVEGLTTKSQNELAGAFGLIGSSFEPRLADPQAKLPDEDRKVMEKMSATARKYGIDGKVVEKFKASKESDPAKRLSIFADAIKDKKAFLIDFSAQYQSGLKKLKIKELKDVKQNGEGAKGVVILAAEQGEIPLEVEFVQTNGVWKLQFVDTHLIAR